jgi:8-oxo-dGTP pyrophosphatase MutT (NUDIX family)
MILQVGVKILLKNSEGKYLLARRNPKKYPEVGPKWDIIGGRINPGSALIENLKREIKEEVGITDLMIKEVMRVWHLYRGPVSAENDLVGITYYCTTDTETVKLSAEHVAYEWTTPEMALQRIKVEGIREDIQRFIQLKKMKETHFY